MALPVEYILSLLPPLLLVGFIIYIACWFLVFLISLLLWPLKKCLFRTESKNATTVSKAATTSPDAENSNNNNNKTGESTSCSVLISKRNIFTVLPIFVFCIADHRYDMHNNNGLHDLIVGQNPQLQALIEKMPSLQRGPNPPLFFKNRHLQFIPFIIQNELHRSESLQIPFQRIPFEVAGCYNKTETGIDNHCDELPTSSSSSSGMKMTDTITLDIFPPFEHVEADTNYNMGSINYNQHFNISSPIIVYAPGLRCDSQDMPGNSIIRRAYKEGFRSIVVNRRGHTPASKLKSPRWSLFGDVHDLEDVYWYIKHNITKNTDTPIFLHGISSGTAVVVSGLAVWDKRKKYQPHKPTPTFVGSVSVTPGYDISKVLEPERFKFPYNNLITPMVKEHFVKQNEHVLRNLSTTAVDNALKASTLQEFFDSTMPFIGYTDKKEYYKHENPINDIHYISTPKLVLNSKDDPCCDINNLYEISPLEHHKKKSFAQLVKESVNGIVAVSKTGSHIPFIDSSSSSNNVLDSSFFFPSVIKDPLYQDSYMLDTWGDRVSMEFYKAALQVYNDRRFL